MNFITNVVQAAIKLDLATIVAASRTKPVWYEAFTKLSPESTGEERLAVYQAVRDSGCLPPEASHYLISSLIEDMVLESSDVTVDHLNDQLTAIEEAHGLKLGEPWPMGQPPKEWQEINRAARVAWEATYVRKLEEFGEHDMARQYRDDPDGFQKLNSLGREFIYGPE